jgi:predicted DNA-binding protein with PD1-like motif
MPPPRALILLRKLREVTEARMRWQLLDEAGGRRTFALAFDKGDEPVEALGLFAREQGLAAAHFTALGAFREATVGFFDRERRDYARVPIRAQVEVLTLVGNVARDGDELKVHAHVVLGRRDGTAWGGHLLSARVWPTLEVVLTEEPAHLRRRSDAETGLPLLALPAPATGR